MRRDSSVMGRAVSSGSPGGWASPGAFPPRAWDFAAPGCYVDRLLIKSGLISGESRHS